MHDPCVERAASVLVLILVQVSLGADVPFARVAIDNSINDPWAKIIADIDRDGFADIVIGGQAGPWPGTNTPIGRRPSSPRVATGRSMAKRAISTAMATWISSWAV